MCERRKACMTELHAIPAIHSTVSKTKRSRKRALKPTDRAVADVVATMTTGGHRLSYSGNAAGVYPSLGQTRPL